MKLNSKFIKFSVKAMIASALFFCLLLVNTFTVVAQTTNEYTSDQTANLMTDLAAGTYDIYELSTSGGAYLLTSTTNPMINLSKSVTIRAKSGLQTKPVITISGTNTSSTASVFGISSEDFVLELEGIEFNGINADGEQPILVLSTTTAINCKVTIHNCSIHDFNNSAGNGTIRFEGTEGSSLDVQNTSFDNCNGRMLNFYTPEGNTTTTVNDITNGDVTLKNCTFSNMDKSLTNANNVLYYRSVSSVFAKGKNATIDHCTFYNITISKDEVLKFRMMSGLVSITNCVFDKVDAGISFVNPDNTAPAKIIDNCYLGFATPPAGTNTITVDPVYADEYNLDFGLINKSDFVGSDQLTVGDTRYYSFATAAVLPMKENAGFRMYPNPASALVNFEFKLNSDAIVQLHLYSITGQLVKTFIPDEYKNAGKYSKTIDVSNFGNGAYFARFTAGGSSKTMKLIINK